jgi:hypothetical protein
MQIKILESAIQDLIHGYKFYESQGFNLGSYFLDSLFSDIDSLLISAGIHRMHFRKFRLLSKRFPFAIYYAMNDDRSCACGLRLPSKPTKSVTKAEII